MDGVPILNETSHSFRDVPLYYSRDDVKKKERKNIYFLNNIISRCTYIYIYIRNRFSAVYGNKVQKTTFIRLRVLEHPWHRTELRRICADTERDR